MAKVKTNVGVSVEYEDNLTFEELKAKNKALNEQALREAKEKETRE